jgi:hypothetical protein
VFLIKILSFANNLVFHKQSGGGEEHFALCRFALQEKKGKQHKKNLKEILLLFRKREKLKGRK